MSSIYQLRISIKNAKPEIYRTIQIEKGCDFYFLHLVIQELMDWSGRYYFEFDSQHFKIVEENLFNYGQMMYSHEISLQSVMMNIMDSIEYLYGDSRQWSVDVTLEKILSSDNGQVYPLCIDGMHNSPPEECAGIAEFNDKINQIRNNGKIDDKTDDLFENFDPEFINIPKKNRFFKLLYEDYYKNDLWEPISEEDQEMNFEGYNLDEMESIVTKEFTHNWPVIIKNIDDATFQHMPLLKLMHYILNIIQKEERIPLTTGGNFKRKLVAEVYNLFSPVEKPVEMYGKAINEEDSNFIHLSHLMLDMTGYVKKRYNHLYLTKKGKKVLSDISTMGRDVFTVFCNNFNWSYFDGFQNHLVARFGFGFSIILLEKYGEKFRNYTFYAEKYFTAYPTLDYSKNEKNLDLCYYLRTMERFLYYFGLVELSITETELNVKKSKIFDDFFAIIPPVGLQTQPLGIS